MFFLQNYITIFVSYLFHFIYVVPSTTISQRSVISIELVFIRGGAAMVRPHQWVPPNRPNVLFVLDFRKGFPLELSSFTPWHVDQHSFRRRLLSVAVNLSRMPYIRCATLCDSRAIFGWCWAQHTVSTECNTIAMRYCRAPGVSIKHV